MSISPAFFGRESNKSRVIDASRFVYIRFLPSFFASYAVTAYNDLISSFYELKSVTGSVKFTDNSIAFESELSDVIPLLS